MIQLLGRATSGNVQKVLFLLEELGLLGLAVISQQVIQWSAVG